jgi:hypothetical protein
MVTHLPDRSRAAQPRASDPDRLDRYRRELLAADLGYGPLLIGLVLSLHADHAGVAVMSRTELARAASMDLRAIVRNHLPVLTGKSWLDIVAPPASEARRGARSRYTLVIPSEAATVTAIEPGRAPVTVRRLADRLACTELEAAAVVAAIKADTAGTIRNLGGLLNRMADADLAEYLADVRAQPVAEPATESTPERCTDHDMPGGTMATGQLRCPMCRAQTRGGTSATTGNAPPLSRRR